MLKKEGKSQKESTEVVKTTEELPVGPPRFKQEPTPPVISISTESIFVAKKTKRKKAKKLAPILSPAPKPLETPKPIQSKPVTPKPNKLPQKPKPASKPIRSKQPSKPLKSSSDNPPYSALFTPITLPSKIDKNEEKELVSKIKFVKKSKDLKADREKVSQEKQLKLPPKEKNIALVPKSAPLIRQPPTIEGRPSRNKKIILIIILLVVVAVVLLLVYLFLNHKEPSRRDLMVAGDVKEAYVLEDAVYVFFYPYDSEAVKTISVAFLDDKGNSYPYIIQELSAEYKFYATDLGLKNLDRLVAVSGIIEYKPGAIHPPNVTPTPPPNVTSNLTKKKPSGGGSSGGTTTPPISCTNDTGCFSRGISCSGNLPYNCSFGSDGCFDRENLTACGTGWQCTNGTGCEEIKDCATDGECDNLDNYCSYGICNSTGKCEVRFNQTADLCRAALGECDDADYCSGSSSDCFDSKKADSTACSSGKCLSGSCVQCTIDSDCSTDGCFSGAYRDYFCNLTNGCSYNVITKTENSTNGNCNDGIDNDCDGQTDGADSGCGTAAVCGNNIIEGTEVCDGTALAGKTCADFGYSGGTLGCLANCFNYDTSSCTSDIVELSSCQTLSQAGKTYKLVNNITIPGSVDCFIISSNEITLDCQNHKITGASAKSAIKITGARTKSVKNCILENVGNSASDGAIYISANNVTIENNQITNSYKAIRSSGVSYLSIRNNLIKNNNYGIETSSIILDSVIENNVIGSSTYHGISLSGNRVLIKNNNITNNQQYGIYSASGTFSNNVIKGNNISRNTLDGVYTSSSGNNNSFIENTISGNQGGINLGASSSSNNLTGNTICSRNAYSDDISCFASQKKAIGNACNNVNFICSIMGGITCDSTCGSASSLNWWEGIKQSFKSIW